MKDDISNLINAVGAMSELLKVFYDNLIKQGFTNQEALYLTSDYMKMMFRGSEQ